MRFVCAAVIRAPSFVPLPAYLQYFQRNSTKMVKSSQNTVRVWQRADAVCFDVDSTIIREEGLDDLAKFCGKGEEVAAMTRFAMGGAINYRQSLERRLNIFKPSKEILKQFLQTHQFNLSPGIRNLIQKLQNRGTAVYMISGGFQCIIHPLANKLGVPKDHVFANRLMHDSRGNYIGFDTSCPTSDSHGKAKAVQMIKARHNYQNIVMIGDGATDMEACPPAHAFIGFGGNVVREEVKSKCSWYVFSFDELSNALENNE